MIDVGRYIDEMHAVRADKRFHEAEIKRLDAQIKLMEGTLMQEMQAQGTTLAAGRMAKAELKLDVLYPQVESWDALHNQIANTGAFDLLHKRISLTYYRQLCEANQDPAGTLRNYVTEISMRSL